MMNRNIVIGVAFGVMPFLAVAGGTTDSNSTTRLETNLGKGCHIAITLPRSAQGGIGGDPSYGSGGFEVNPFPISWKFKSFPRLYFRLFCQDADKGGIDEASFDPQTETWKKDVDKRIKSLGFEVSPQEYKGLYADFDKAIRIYNLTAVNSKGFASTEVDTTGDEKNRRRQMGFCLFHPPKALCGGGVVGYIPDGPKSDLSVRVTEILRTIEFLPDAE
jgi:hypothetical protein